MKTVRHILDYELRDLLRSTWLIVYAVFFVAVTGTLLYFGGGGRAAVLSLINVVLILVPLVGVLFGTMYLYASREFIELLLSQPVSRTTLYGGMYCGLAFPLALAYVVGIGAPIILFSGSIDMLGRLLITLAGTGVGLTLAFVAIAFVIATIFEDRVRGMSVAIIVWLGATVIYDAVILYVVHAFAEYPLETPVLLLSILNPVDLARILLLLTFDISALMGYTGAVFERFFGSGVGVAVSAAAMVSWVAIPLFLGLARFRRKDF